MKQPELFKPEPNPDTLEADMSGTEYVALVRSGRWRIVSLDVLASGYHVKAKRMAPAPAPARATERPAPRLPYSDP